MTRTWPRAVMALTLGLVAACGPPAPPTTGPTESPPAVSPPASTLVASSPGWRTDPVTVRNSPAVPPVPVITEVRYAGHPEDGYDRIVFTIEGGLPGYSLPCRSVAP